jgi:putative transcriptional regulator
MAEAPQTLAGRLLVSHPQLRDDHFRETVVLLHTHDTEEGALGVIVNRPLGRVFGRIDFTAELKPLDDVPLFEGGPVATNRLAFGGWFFPAQGSPEVRFGLGQEEAAQLAKDGRFRLSAYIGYAGWSPGQLENELKMNAWVVCPFDALCVDFEGVELWKKLLERHRPDLRLEADSPENPGLN